MEKNSFINSFPQWDKNYISNIYDNIMLCKKIRRTIFTKEFVSPYIYNKLMLMEHELGVKTFCYGVFEEAERKMLAFDLYEEPEDYPIDLIKIVNKSKFKVLTHRDFLGTLMSFGVKREVLGDLLVENDYCYVPVIKDITSYIFNNLETIGNCPCEIEILDKNPDNIPKVKYEEKVIIITSLRLDNTISGICNLSRNEVNTLINNGSIMINHVQSSKRDKLVKPQDIVTVRGYGKYKIEEIVGETQKNRLKIAIKKYI
ncbi:YlmH/Sll1252 family protein [Clostridium sp.]|uniref:YlmH family RNA-binding protein n=1 Tax=Clostridium sp. TaxID=1506 RepID=UPI002FCA9592